MKKQNKKNELISMLVLMGALSFSCFEIGDELEQEPEKKCISMDEDNSDIVMANINTDLKEINYNAIVKNDTKLYVGPSDEYSVVYPLSKKDEVEVLARSVDSWLLIRYKNNYGFVKKNDLDLTSTIIPQTYSSNLLNKYYKIICLKDDSELKYHLNDDEYEDIPKYECGKVFNETENYYFIETEDTIGYVPKEAAIELKNKFVIVDISEQKLRLYEDTRVKFETDVVSGRDSSPTDLGIESVKYKQKNRTLVGRGYRSHVNYWMRINSNAEGLHDATWRSEFGGDIYQKNGSHGCVNLPLESAKYLYDELKVGDKVIVKK